MAPVPEAAPRFLDGGGGAPPSGGAPPPWRPGDGAWSVLAIAFGAAAVWILVRVQAVLFVLIGSLLLAALLEPAVAAAARLRLGHVQLGRRPAAAVVVLVAVLAIGAAVYIVVPSLWQQGVLLARELPGYAAVARRQLNDLLQGSRLFSGDAVRAVEGELTRALGQMGQRAAGWAFSVAAGALQALGYLVIPLGTFYVLSDGARLRHDLAVALPPAWRPHATVFLDRSAWALSAYVRGQTAVCAAAAVLYSLIFGALGLSHAVAFGVLAGLAEAVPVLGSLLVAVTVAITGLASGLGVALRCLAGYVVGNQVVNYGLAPRLLSRELDLHPFYVILAVLVGAGLGGLGGALLALPAAAVLQALLRHHGASGAESGPVSSGTPTSATPTALPPAAPPGQPAGAPPNRS